VVGRNIGYLKQGLGLRLLIILGNPWALRLGSVAFNRAIASGPPAIPSDWTPVCDALGANWCFLLRVLGLYLPALCGLQADCNPWSLDLFSGCWMSTANSWSVWILLPSSSALGRLQVWSRVSYSAAVHGALRWAPASGSPTAPSSMVVVHLEASISRSVRSSTGSSPRPAGAHDRAGGKLGAPPPS